MGAGGQAAGSDEAQFVARAHGHSVAEWCPLQVPIESRKPAAVIDDNVQSIATWVFRSSGYPACGGMDRSAHGSSEIETAMEMAGRGPQGGRPSSKAGEAQGLVG